MNKVIVIGGGAAGMIAAGTAGENGCDVTLIERNNKLGRKLNITGKGRCNLTNASDPQTLIDNTMASPYFMYSAYYGFDSSAVMEFFERLGVKLKVERGKRVFPVSDKAVDIVKALEKYMKQNDVKVMLNTRVRGIETENSKVKAVITDKGKINCDKIIIATGGKSYPVTGSTGDGFKMALSVGHTVTPLYPALVPLRTEEKWAGEMQGLSLKNVSVSVMINNKKIYSDFGEMMFTHFGITGPLILTASRYITDRLSERPEVYIDLKPALSEKELDARMLRDFEKYINKEFKNSLDDLLPQKMIPIIIRLSEIDAFKRVNEITKEERRKLVRLIKGLKLTVIDTNGYAEAIVTAGGVNTDEIDPSTMQSKICKGLYFAGEVVDVDCVTGGFNLQACFSMGRLAGTII